MVKFDMDKCVGCGKCAAVCPGLVLGMKDGRPAVVGGSCIECGHCVEVCTHRAVSLAGGPTATAGWETELEKNVLTRRSIRNYLPAAPDRKVLERALHIAGWAPSAKNQNKNGWTVVYGREKVRGLLGATLDWCRENGKNRGIVRLCESGTNLVTCDAPCLVFAWADEVGYSDTDCAIALTTLELLLHEKNLGTCWGGFATRVFSSSPEVLALAGIPEGKKLCATLMVGYPAEEYQGVPARPELPCIWRD